MYSQTTVPPLPGPPGQHSPAMHLSVPSKNVPLQQCTAPVNVNDFTAFVPSTTTVPDQTVHPYKAPSHTTQLRFDQQKKFLNNIRDPQLKKILPQLQDAVDYLALAQTRAGDSVRMHLFVENETKATQKDPDNSTPGFGFHHSTLMSFNTFFSPTIIADTELKESLLKELAAILTKFNVLQTQTYSRTRSGVSNQTAVPQSEPTTSGQIPAVPSTPFTSQGPGTDSNNPDSTQPQQITAIELPASTNRSQQTNPRSQVPSAINEPVSKIPSGPPSAPHPGTSDRRQSHTRIDIPSPTSQVNSTSTDPHRDPLTTAYITNVNGNQLLPDSIQITFPQWFPSHTKKPVLKNTVDDNLACAGPDRSMPAANTTSANLDNDTSINDVPTAQGSQTNNSNCPGARVDENNGEADSSNSESSLLRDVSILSNKTLNLLCVDTTQFADLQLNHLKLIYRTLFSTAFSRYTNSKKTYSAATPSPDSSQRVSPPFSTSFSYSYFTPPWFPSTIQSTHSSAYCDFPDRMLPDLQTLRHGSFSENISLVLAAFRTKEPEFSKHALDFLVSTYKSLPADDSIFQTAKKTRKRKRKASTNSEHQLKKNRTRSSKKSTVHHGNTHRTISQRRPPPSTSTRQTTPAIKNNVSFIPLPQLLPPPPHPQES